MRRAGKKEATQLHPNCYNAFNSTASNNETTPPARATTSTRYLARLKSYVPSTGHGFLTAKACKAANGGDVKIFESDIMQFLEREFPYLETNMLLSFEKRAGDALPGASASDRFSPNNYRGNSPKERWAGVNLKLEYESEHMALAAMEGAGGEPLLNQCDTRYFYRAARTEVPALDKALPVRGMARPQHPVRAMRIDQLTEDDKAFLAKPVSVEKARIGPLTYSSAPDPWARQAKDLDNPRTQTMNSWGFGSFWAGPGEAVGGKTNHMVNTPTHMGASGHAKNGNGMAMLGGGVPMGAPPYAMTTSAGGGVVTKGGLIRKGPPGAPPHLGGGKMTVLTSVGGPADIKCTTLLQLEEKVRFRFRPPTCRFIAKARPAPPPRSTSSTLSLSSSTSSSRILSVEARHPSEQAATITKFTSNSHKLLKLTPKSQSKSSAVLAAQQEQASKTATSDRAVVALKQQMNLAPRVAQTAAEIISRSSAKARVEETHPLFAKNIEHLNRVARQWQKTATSELYNLEARRALAWACRELFWDCTHKEGKYVGTVVNVAKGSLALTGHEDEKNEMKTTSTAEPTPTDAAAPLLKRNKNNKTKTVQRRWRSGPVKTTRDKIKEVDTQTPNNWITRRNNIKNLNMLYHWLGLTVMVDHQRKLRPVTRAASARGFRAKTLAEGALVTGVTTSTGSPQQGRQRRLAPQWQ
eukprot:g5040.t1